MVARDKPKLVTAEELLAMPEGDGKRELVQGEIVEMSPSRRPHGRISGQFYRLLLERSNAFDLGEVTVEGPGYILALDRDTVRAPDVAYTSNARLVGVPEEGFYTVAPDLAIEVMSPDDSAEDIQKKASEYLRAGTTLVVVVYPKLRVLHVHQKGAIHQLTMNDTLDLNPVIPGLTLPVADIFSVLDKRAS